MRILESKVERAACRKIKDLGVRNVKLMQLRGWPDRMFLIPGGHPLFIEFKRPGEKAKAYQQHVHRILRRLGYEVQVHDTVDGAIEAICKALETASIPEEGC